jgi:hypothetical protein
VTLSRPRTTRRVLRGSALGLGLLVAGGITAPAAFAIEDPQNTADQPGEEDGNPAPLQETPELTPAEAAAVLASPLSGNFGTGKDFSVQVAPKGPVPADLDLSGAVFRATSTTGATYDCTTDVEGWCTFEGPEVAYPGIGDIVYAVADGVDPDVPTGTYLLTQQTSSAGLAVNTGSATFAICDSWFCDMGQDEDTAVVGNDSLFRTELVTTVTDSATGAPVGCAGYELTGPDYPHDGGTVPAVAAADPVPAECVPTTAPTTTAPTTTAPTTTAPTTTGPTTTETGSSSPAPLGDDTPEDTADETTDPTVTVEPDVVELQGFARDDETHSFGTQTSSAAGTLTFRGWFLPAPGYLLTPTTMPAGYTPDAADTFGITTTARQAAASTPAKVVRTVSTQLAGGAPAPAPGSGAATAAPTTTAAGAAPTTPGTPAAQAALATTGTPVETMALLGGGLVALGAGALATGGVLRRRARQRA